MQGILKASQWAAGIATTFCAISCLALALHTKGQEREPLKTYGFAALYGYLTYRSARQSSRYNAYVRTSPKTPDAVYYRQQSALQWNFAQLTALYGARAFSITPEAAVLSGVFDLAAASAFTAGAYYCQNRAKRLSALAA